MADKEEVEPTEESSATESSAAAGDLDATDEDTVEGTDDPIEPGEIDDRGEPDDVDLGQFDEIVRDSGIDGSSETPDGTAESDSSKVLEPAGVGAASAGTVSERRAARKAKETATNRRDQPVKTERTTPVKFVRESVGELRKVVYPTGQQLVNYFIVVLVFVLFVIAYVSLLDLGLGWAIFKVFS